MAQLPDIRLERASGVPLGTQLGWQLRAAIAAGALRGGDRLPGVRELAGSVGVNVNTVRAVYARLAAEGVVVSEQGRGTFVSDAPGAAGAIGDLVERTAREARRRHVDPRELAAILYARFDEPSGAARAPLPVAAHEIEERRALRAEIEALEHALATLEAPRAPSAGDRPPEPDPPATAAGARLMSAAELAATRDALAERLGDRRRELRRARASRHRAPEPAASARPEPSAWPELLALRPPRLAAGG